MIKTCGLNHININVKDVEHSVRFYKQAFGLQEMFREDNGRMVFLRTPGADDTITLCQTADPSQIGGRGIDHFGFKVASPAELDKAAAIIEQAGGKTLRRGQHAPGVQFLYLQDPDGYTIELGN